jgi:hypothetical protein
VRTHRRGTWAFHRTAPGVVEALDAQRFAQGDRALFVALAAAEGAPVRADLTPPRTTGLHRGLGPHPGVDGPERRRGQGDEELGMARHADIDALAAADARGDEVPGVLGVDARARRADRGPAVLARNQQVAVPQLPRRAIERQPPQADRVRAQTGLVDLGQERPPVRGRAHHHAALRRAAAMAASSAMASSSR